MQALRIKLERTRSCQVARRVSTQAAPRPHEAEKQRQTMAMREQTNPQVRWRFGVSPQVSDLVRTWLAAKGSGVRVPSAPLTTLSISFEH